MGSSLPLVGVLVTSKMLLASVTEAILAVPPFPFLWIPHCILCCLGLRATLGADALQFARRHPLSCFLHGLSYTYAGAIVGLVLKGKSILLILTMSSKLYSYTFVWYLMFFAPGDLPNAILTKLQVQPLLAAAQDWMRLGAVRANVIAALEEQPGTFIYPVALATLTSSGLMIVKYVEQLLLGKDCAFVIKQHATKTMATAAVILTAESKGYFQALPPEELFCALVIAAILLRLLVSFLSKDWDPYSLVESPACSLLYGKPAKPVDQKNGNPTQATDQNKDKKTN